MVTIIVPVYNAEKYIERCIKSVLSQSCSSFELIIVNDGSTDSTDKICKNICSPHANCYILEQPNMGVSAARNYGISRATGKWIAFLDSDDFLEPDFVETLEKYSSTDNADFMLFNYSVIGRDIMHNNIRSWGGVYQDNHLLIDGVINSNSNIFSKTSLRSPWAKAYRTKIIHENNLHFEKDVTIGEDMLFNLAYYFLIRNFIYVDRVVYNYQYSDDSFSRRFNSNLIETDIAFHKNMNQILDKYRLVKQYENQTGKFIVNGYLSCLKRCIFNPENPEPYSKRVKKAIELTKSKPYCDVLKNQYIVQEHCKGRKKDRLFIYCAKHNNWRIIEWLMRIKQIKAK